MTKNDTRLASLMGTWTVDSRIKSNFGLYEIDMNFVIYLMGDPLRENSCELPDCAELNNSFCRYENDSGSGPPICENMATNISNWSDGSLVLVNSPWQNAPLSPPPIIFNIFFLSFFCPLPQWLHSYILE